MCEEKKKLKNAMRLSIEVNEAQKYKFKQGALLRNRTLKNYLLWLLSEDEKRYIEENNG